MMDINAKKTAGGGFGGYQKMDFRSYNLPENLKSFNPKTINKEAINNPYIIFQEKVHIAEKFYMGLDHEFLSSNKLLVSLIEIFKTEHYSEFCTVDNFIIYLKEVGEIDRVGGEARIRDILGVHRGY